ncbi:MAG: hypothetical protein FWC70_03125 [Defluviitaleaceae bacterium]|nr:hypothetical protein [Defluviitaleaceae bacterium]
MLAFVWRILKKIVPAPIKRRIKSLINNEYFAVYNKKLFKKDKKIKALLGEFEKVPVYSYGSLTPGRQDWEEKWNKSKGKRILMYALKDYAGSFYRWAEAVNRHTDFAVRMVAFYKPNFSSEYDLLLPFPHVLERSNMQQLIQEADLVHIKDETGFYFKTNNLPKDMFSNFSGPMVYSACGGYFRNYAGDTNFQKYVLGFDARVAMTPDLIHPWFDGVYLPQAIDTEKYPYCWEDGSILAHSPSSQAKKGTADLTEAIEGLDIHFDLIHGVSHSECVQRKQQATLFFDQAGRAKFLKKRMVVGYYGNSALESAVFGIPTIAHISERAFEGAVIGGKDIRETSAILNTQLGADEIRKVVTNFFELSSEERKAVSLRTRRWVEDFHSYQVCAGELAELYNRLLGLSRTENE